MAHPNGYGRHIAPVDEGGFSYAPQGIPRSDTLPAGQVLSMVAPPPNERSGWSAVRATKPEHTRKNIYDRYYPE